ncbi:biotin transporter BioY [Eubacterium multiforme]|uniref:Biotin transporter n=1 Tax=Eubacterium multiforme TaxID=83339 RepID=A0ABT9UNJ5_9FIRM|nr:biotin transporter BioY [Eubacterium multiforme]MDQ0148212.1 biotin transport system substrate-specific component [Eubacterium multiforme]
MKLKTRDLTLIAMFAALTAIGAFIRIPIPIVPFTLQYFFCALGAIILGSKKGALAQVLYVGIGLIGIPVFTQGGGPQYILKPTFGYLIGFIVGAFIIGKITEKIKELNIFKIFIACISGLAVIYLFGIIHMLIIYNFYLGEGMSLWTAVSVGIIACLPSDLLLSFIISIVSVRVVPQLRKLGYVN